MISYFYLYIFLLIKNGLILALATRPCRHVSFLDTPKHKAEKIEDKNWGTKILYWSGRRAWTTIISQTNPSAVLVREVYFFQIKFFLSRSHAPESRNPVKNEWIMKINLRLSPIYTLYYLPPKNWHTRIIVSPKSQ